MSDSDFKPGEIVNVAYTGYNIQAKVIEPQAPNWPAGWVLVEQITDYEDEERRPRFEAAEEYISRPGEPNKPGPFDPGWQTAALARMQRQS